MQPTKPADLPYALLGEMAQGAPSQGLPSEGTTTENTPATQELTTVYITTMYYCALANLYLQSILPGDSATVDAEMPRVKMAVERSYADFTTASSWLTAHGADFIPTSPAKQYYDEVLAMDAGSVKNIATVYSQ